MLRHRARRLIRKLVTLFVLVAALTAVSSNPPQSAAYDCELCNIRYDHCISVCDPCSSAEEFQCELKRHNCWAGCD